MSQSPQTRWACHVPWKIYDVSNRLLEEVMPLRWNHYQPHHILLFLVVTRLECWVNISEIMTSTWLCHNKHVDNKHHCEPPESLCWYVLRFNLCFLQAVFKNNTQTKLIIFVHACMPIPRKLRQEDWHEFEASLGFKKLRICLKNKQEPGRWLSGQRLLLSIPTSRVGVPGTHMK